MPQFHLRFDLPDEKPFDRPDWQIQVQGEIVAPFVNTHQPTRLWFSHYGGLENGKHLLIRYEAEHKAEDSILTFPPSEHYHSDIHQDLGGARFLGNNQQTTDSGLRGSMIFDFLNSAARLTLSQLSHQVDGYWVREKSSDTGNNHFGSPLESVHHLFCNLSAVDTAVALIPTHQQIQILSVLYAKINKLYQPTTQVVPVMF